MSHPVHVFQGKVLATPRSSRLSPCSGAPPTLAEDDASSPGPDLEDLDEISLDQSPPTSSAPKKGALPALPPSIPAAAAASSPAEKMPSPHRRDDDFYRERARDIKAQRDKAIAEQQAAQRAAEAASGGGMLGNMDDDGFSVGSASDGSIDLPGF